MEQPWEWDAHFLQFLAKHHLFEKKAQLTAAAGRVEPGS